MQGAKVRASISASRYGMQQQHATTTTTTSDQIGPAQHDAAVSATCVKARFVEEMGGTVVLIAAVCCGGPIRMGRKRSLASLHSLTFAGSAIILSVLVLCRSEISVGKK